MIHNLEICLEVGVADLLEEDVEFSFDFFGEAEEIELILLFLRKKRVHKLLELMRSSCDW